MISSSFNIKFLYSPLGYLGKNRQASSKVHSSVTFFRKETAITATTSLFSVGGRHLLSIQNVKFKLFFHMKNLVLKRSS